jgi:hypothetical protein
MFNLCGFYVFSNPMYWTLVKTGVGVRNKLMSIQEVSAERFAQLFHHYHQALAEDSGSPSNIRTKDAWENVPPSEKSKLIAATRLALLEVELVPSERQPRAIFCQARRSRVGLLSRPGGLELAGYSL